MPSLIFIFDTKISKWPLFEAYNLEIPTSSIINSSSLYIDFINYPVIGNNKSFEAIYLYVNFIRNAIMKGKQKERLKILRIL
jgi:ribosomal protein S2